MTALVFAPAAHVVAWRRQTGLAAEPLEDVVVGHPEIDLARALHLLLEAAGEEGDAVVVEGSRSGVDRGPSHEIPRQRCPLSLVAAHNGFCSWACPMRYLRSLLASLARS